MSRLGVHHGFLAQMAAASRARAAELARRVGAAELERRARAAPPPPPLRLSAAGFDLVAEVKFASPAAGTLARASAARAAEQACRYERAGAAAVSVLTEPTRFAGSLGHLVAVARAVAVPVLCKDFLVDPLQVHEARSAGASGVLLILRMLDGPALEAMLGAARACRLFVLLEAFDEADLERATSVLAGAEPVQLLVGVNSRDLDTLAVVPERHLALAACLPPGVPCVAESGIASAADARAAAEAGYRLALVGSALMRASDPAALARNLLAGGRSGARRGP